MAPTPPAKGAAQVSGDYRFGRKAGLTAYREQGPRLRRKRADALADNLEVRSAVILRLALHGWPRPGELRLPVPIGANERPCHDADYAIMSCEELKNLRTYPWGNED